MTTDNRKADARWYLALLLWFAANVAAGAAIVGAIDIAFDKSVTGHLLLLRGIGAMVACAVLALLIRPGRPREGHRFATIAIGLWPFTMFFFFIVWRSGVSAEQRVACHDGDTQACYRLAERLDRRGKPEDAVDIYSIGCAAGGAQCCLMHGSLLERGRGTEPAAEEALVAYDNGCQLGDALACWRWSQLGERTNAPEVEISEHVDRACSLGYANACAGAAQGSP
jgi:hypothetical protein